MIAMTVLGTGGPITAFAQVADIDFGQQIGDLTNAAAVNTGGNIQINVAETNQGADNSIEIENEAESGDATAVQVLTGVTFDNDVNQASATIQTNTLDDSDVITVTQANVPVQTQTNNTATAIATLIEGIVDGVPGDPGVSGGDPGGIPPIDDGGDGGLCDLCENLN